jgi:adenylate kinase
MSLDTIQVGEYFFEKFISKEQINAIVQRMAVEIDDYYKNIDPLEFIIILDGAYHFASDFTRAFPRDVKLHFVKIKSYEGFQSSGKARTSPPKR